MPAPPRARPAAAASRAGFTLVELMVVLAVVGLLGTAVLLTVPAPEAALRREAEALAVRLGRAQQEAILSTRALRVEVDARGYRFSIARSGGWQALSEPPFAPVAWAPGVAPALPDADAALWIGFDPLGVAEPATLVLGDGRQAVGVEVGADGLARVVEAR